MLSVKPRKTQTVLVGEASNWLYQGTLGITRDVLGESSETFQGKRKENCIETMYSSEDARLLPIRLTE